jgi:hypothetical protein
MKSVPNLIFYLHKFFGNFSQFLAICFELFSFRVNLNSEIANERAPPVRRRAPCRACAAARRCRVAATCRVVARGLKPLSRQSRLARTTAAPTASCASPSPRPPRTRRPTAPAQSPRRSRRRPHAGGRLFLTVSHAPAPCRRRLVEQRRHRAAPPPCSAAAARSCHAPRVVRADRGWAAPAPRMRTVPRVAAGRARTVHLGREWFRPRGTQIDFYFIFLIYSIHCKFKNLCRIHLNSENYETNFVGKV